MLKTRSSKVVYQNKWMTVKEDDVEFPDGHRGVWGVVEKDDFVLIIPFDDTHFYLVRQYRYPIRRYSWEFPQGKHEDGPTLDPSALAQAELREETGLAASAVEKIGFLHEAPGYANQGLHIFFATQLSQRKQQLEKTEQGFEIKKVTHEKLQQMILDGSITDAPTVAAYAILTLKKLV